MLGRGIRKNEYSDMVHSVLKYSDRDFARIAGTSARTLSRLKPEQNVPAQVAEVVISLLRALGRATEIFGSEENAVSWLKRKNTVLGGISPVEAMQTRFGAEEVMDALGRIEYGVYS